MRNGEVITLFEGLEALAQNKGFKFKPKVAYTIAKNHEKARSEASTIYKLRQDIIQSYGYIEDNGDVTIEKGKLAAANRDIEDLMELESEIQIRMIEVEDLGDNEIGLEEMKGLKYMIKSEDEDENEEAQEQ